MDVVANIRLVEDSLAFVLLSIALGALANAVIQLRGVPVRFVPLSLVVGLVPLYVWKALGSVRRMLVDKGASPGLYDSLHDIGEVFESLSGLAMAGCALYLLFKLRKLQARPARR